MISQSQSIGHYLLVYNDLWSNQENEIGTSIFRCDHYIYFFTDIPSSPNRKTSLRDDELIPGSLNREQRDSFHKPHSALIVSYKRFE